MFGISKEFCVDDAMPNSCLSLFTNMRSKREGRFLGQGLWSNLFYYLHINYAIVVLFIPLDSLFSLLKKWGEVCVGWNVRGVKCLRGEMSSGWNVLTPCTTGNLLTHGISSCTFVVVVFSPMYNKLRSLVHQIKCSSIKRHLQAFNLLGFSITSETQTWKK